MATTLDTYAPFDAGPGANISESTWRKFMRHMLADGVLATVTNEFEVFADSTGMQVKVKTGECWIRGHWGESTAQKTLAIATAHATLGRKDRVILRCDFTNNRIELDVLTGTASGSPALPSLTQDTTKWEIGIGQVTVDAAVSTIAASKITDERLRVGAAGGSAEYTQGSAQNITTGGGAFTKISYDTSVRTTTDISVSGAGNTDFKVKRPGVWAVTATIVLNGGGSTALRRLAIVRNSDSRRLASASDYSNAEVSLNVATTRHFNLDEEIHVGLLHDAGTTLATLPGSNSMSVALTWISDA